MRAPGRKAPHPPRARCATHVPRLIGAGPSVVEDNGTIAMGKSGGHDDRSAFAAFISMYVVGDCFHDLNTVRMHHDALDPLSHQLRGRACSDIVAGYHSLLHEPLDFLGGDASDHTGTCFVILQSGLADIVMISLTIALGRIARAHRVAPVVEQSPGEGATSWGAGRPAAPEDWPLARHSRSTSIGE